MTDTREVHPTKPGGVVRIATGFKLGRFATVLKIYPDGNLLLDVDGRSQEYGPGEVVHGGSSPCPRCGWKIGRASCRERV